MSVARFVEIERGSSEVRSKGATDDPRTPYPTVCANGRGAHRTVLQGGRRLPPPQPEGRALQDPQAALGLGGHHPHPVPAAAGHREPAVLPARCRTILGAPVPRGGRPLALLVPSPRARKLRRYLEPLRRSVLPELVGEP